MTGVDLEQGPGERQSGGPRGRAKRAALAAARFLSTQADPGVVARLRRLDPECPAGADFWWVYLGRVEPILCDEEGGRTPKALREPRLWARLIRLEAFLAGLDQSGRPLGTALAEAGFSAERFERLLRARGRSAEALLERAVLYLRAKSAPSDPGDLCELVLHQGYRPNERFLIRLAGDFYRASSAGA